MSATKPSDMKTMIELLRRLRLFGRPSLQAALEQGRVIGDQVARDQSGRAEKDDQERPSLPEPQIAGRPEDERAHDERERAEPNPSLHARRHGQGHFLARRFWRLQPGMT